MDLYIEVATKEEAVNVVSLIFKIREFYGDVSIHLHGPEARDTSVQFMAAQVGAKIVPTPVDWEASGDRIVVSSMLKLDRRIPVQELAATQQEKKTAFRMAQNALTERDGLIPAPVKIGIITPVHNPKHAHLSACIESVRNQIYPWWEWIVVDDGSTSPEVLNTLHQLAAVDHRVTLHRLERNRGTAQATDIAIRLSQADFLMFLDHDDLVSADAILLISQALQENPSIDAMFSNHITIDFSGRETGRTDKPDWVWDVEELRRDGCIMSHFRGYRRELFSRVGTHDSTLNGCQDFDWLLRAIKMKAIACPFKIPEHIYYWRIHRDSLGHQKNSAHIMSKLDRKHSFGSL